MTANRLTRTEPKYGLYLQNTPGSLGDLATPADLIEYAVAAEEAGWDGVFLADGLSPEFKSIDPWTTLSGVAPLTDEITLGSWITPIPRRQPWQFAHDLATLDHLSGGRVLLGAGLGVVGSFAPFGLERDPDRMGQQYDEALEVLTGLWHGDPFSYDGEFYTTEEAELPLTPLQQPRIPIVLGCWWPNRKPFRRAANWDGIMPVTPAMYGDEGAQGEPVTGSPEAEVREMLDYYRGLTDDPGEIILPIDKPQTPPGFEETCEELGATWLLTTNLLEADAHDRNLDRISEGPPGSGAGSD